MSTEANVAATANAEDEAAFLDDLSMALMRDNAFRSIERIKAAVNADGDAGRSLPLPIGNPEDVTIAEALQAAFLHLEALKLRATDGADALDWSEEMLEADLDISAIVAAK